MKKDINSIGGKVRHPAMRDAAGIGYVIIPNSMDYYEYITSCVRNSSVTIITDTNEIIKNVLVSKQTWQDIDFPKTNDSKGSALVWLNIPNKNKPVVICVLNRKNDLNNNRELNSFNLTRNGDDTSVSIDGDGKSGVLTITVDGQTNKESKIIYKITNENNLGEFNLYVQGDINIDVENNLDFKIKNKLNLQFIDEEDTEKQTNISYELRKGFTYDDEFKNKITADKDKINFRADESLKIDFGDGKEPIALGDALVDILKRLDAADSKMTFPTAFGPTGTRINAAEYEKIKKDFEKIKSKLTNSD